VKESLGGTSGVDKFKGFVGSPEYKARLEGLEQMKNLPPKELGVRLMVKEPVKEQDEAPNRQKRRAEQKVNYGIGDLPPGDFVEQLERAEQQISGMIGKRLK
jgi:hypothetical protein